MKRRTQEHAQFFALIERNLTKPQVIKDFGWINGCWQEIASTKRTPIVTSVTARAPFGVSLENAFANAQTKDK